MNTIDDAECAAKRTELFWRSVSVRLCHWISTAKGGIQSRNPMGTAIGGTIRYRSVHCILMLFRHVIMTS